MVLKCPNEIFTLSAFRRLDGKFTNIFHLVLRIEEYFLLNGNGFFVSHSSQSNVSNSKRDRQTKRKKYLESNDSISANCCELFSATNWKIWFKIKGREPLKCHEKILLLILSQDAISMEKKYVHFNSGWENDEDAFWGRACNWAW